MLMVMYSFSMLQPAGWLLPLSLLIRKFIHSLELKSYIFLLFDCWCLNTIFSLQSVSHCWLRWVTAVVDPAAVPCHREFSLLHWSCNSNIFHLLIADVYIFLLHAAGWLLHSLVSTSVDHCGWLVTAAVIGHCYSDQSLLLVASVSHFCLWLLLFVSWHFC